MEYIKDFETWLNESATGAKPIRKGTKVTWKSGTGKGTGTVSSMHTSSITRTIKGSEITRNGTPENPALVISMEDGGKVLKLRSEVRAAAAA